MALPRDISRHNAEPCAGRLKLLDAVVSKWDVWTFYCIVRLRKEHRKLWSPYRLIQSWLESGPPAEAPPIECRASCVAICFSFAEPQPAVCGSLLSKLQGLPSIG